MNTIIHDIKTERANVSGGLPAGFKIVPVSFYLAAVATIFLSLYFFLSKNAYEENETTSQSQLSLAQSQKSQFISQQQGIVSDARRAEGFAKWLDGAHPLQPVIAAVGRSMGKDSTVAELSLDRNPEIPAHTFLQLKVDGAGSTQIDTTRSDIYALDYLTYSEQQVKGRNSIDFQATLIFNDKP
ncbi:MAG: hypothetical protein P1U85_23135 [Verrucomicrobiales bacterium]|jgi:hypothetical protein|nr:hypothetical protein [Verrucomicrobiales bacterium]